MWQMRIFSIGNRRSDNSVMKRKYFVFFLIMFFVFSSTAIESITTQGFGDAQAEIQDNIIASDNHIETLISSNNQIQDAELFEDITETFPEYIDKVNLFHPERNLIVVKPQIVIKGINRFLTAVFVNGKEIDVRNDGRFYHTYDLLNYGKQVVFITFTTPEYQILNIRRKILRLYSPEDIQDYSSGRKEYINFFNTQYIHQPYDKKLGSKLTRADLAYFIVKVLDIEMPESKVPFFEDVGEEYWAAAAIQALVEKRVMAEFPDGSFRPEAPVTKIEYIITLVRAFGYSLKADEQKLIYEDVELGHWTAKFVRAGLNNGLIRETKNLAPNKELTMAAFIDLVSEIQQVKDTYVELMDFEKGYEVSDELEDERISPAIVFLQNRKEELFNKRNIDFIDPLPNQVVVSRSISFKGHIFPSEEFEINDIKVLPNVGGFFKTDVAAEEGINTFNINALDKVSTMSVFVLYPYEDLHKHWVRRIAAQMRYIGILENTINFYPKQNLTRAEFAYQLVNAFKIETVTSNALMDEIKDLKQDNKYYSAIAALVNNSILKGDKKGFFNPESLISRGEAITAMVRACQQLQLFIKVDKSEDAFLFKDVSDKHWVRKYVDIAYTNGLITKSKFFYPNKPLTKAEFIVMLYKTPPVQETIKEVFER
jgi:hypothetical protein